MERNEQQTKQHHEIEDGFFSLRSRPALYLPTKKPPKKDNFFLFSKFHCFPFQKQPKASVALEFRISSMAPELSVRFS